MELRTYLGILWRRKWVIIITLVVTVTLTLIGTLMATPKYVASTTLRVMTVSSGSFLSVRYDTQYTDRLMNTYAKIAISGSILQELMQKLQIDHLPKIEVEIIAHTELVKITVEDPDPTLASGAANALAQILIDQSRKLLYTVGGRTAQQILSEQLAQAGNELDEARREYDWLATQFPEDSERVIGAKRSITLKENTYAMILEQYEQARIREAMLANPVSVVEPAVVPRSPAKPRKKLNLALGFMVGLVGGVGLAFLFENLDTTLYVTEQIEEITELPVLAKVPVAKRHRQIALFSSSSLQGEAFRRLRTNIFTIGHDMSLNTLLVTSAEAGEGKSTVVANLAFAIAQSGRNVIAVDGDLRRPTLHKAFDLFNEVGLSSVLRQEASFDEAVQDSKIPGIQVLTSGPLPLNPAELLGSPQMVALLEQLAQQFDMVLLDTPALLAVTDAAVLAPMVDGVVLVVGRAQVRQERAWAARQQLAGVKANSIGVVVNRAEQNSSYYYSPSKVRPFRVISESEYQAVHFGSRPAKLLR